MQIGSNYGDEFGICELKAYKDNGNFLKNEDDEMKFLIFFSRFLFGEQSCLAEQHPQSFRFYRWATE